MQNVHASLLIKDFMDLSDSKGNSVSVIILAFNESGNIVGTVASIDKTMNANFRNYEIIIVDDGSSDDTGVVADNLANANKHIRVLHNGTNRGCGYGFALGVSEAKYEFVWVIPGDGEISEKSLDAIAEKIGKYDIILPYIQNFSSRPFSRRMISWGYTSLLNVLFLKNIHYYNGPCVFRTSIVKTQRILSSWGFLFMAPLILRLLDNGNKYVQVGIVLQPRIYGKPSFRSLGSIVGALGVVGSLFWELHFPGPSRRQKTSGIN